MGTEIITNRQWKKILLVVTITINFITFYGFYVLTDEFRHSALFYNDE